MTDKEKLEKIKMLADEMYYRMQNLSTDTSGIRKAMYDYHQFIINEYYKEEPESKDLEDEIDIYTEYLDPKDIKNAPFAHIEECARHFAKWQKEQMEKNRIEHCDNITEEQYNLESDFVSNHIEKNNRIPTILDAIEYGMERQKQQLIDKACEWQRQHMKTLPELLNKDLTKHTLWKRDEIIDKFRQAMEE